MSRDFVSATPSYLHALNSPPSGAPLTFSCWFNVPEETVDQMLISTGDASTTNDEFRMYAGSSSNPSLFIRCRRASNTTAISAGTYSYNTWHHGVGVWASPTSRTAYLDGVAGTPDTTSKTPINIDRMAIGARSMSGFGSYNNGSLAEAAVWTATLDPAEIAALAAGVSPLLIRPHKLFSYTPLVSDDNNDLITGVTWTLEGVPGVSPHIGVIQPSAQILQFPSAAGGTTHETALLMAIQVSESGGNNAVFGAGVTFANALSDAPTNTANFEALTAFTNQLSESSAVTISVEALITFANQLNATQINNAIFGAGVTFAQQVSDQPANNAVLGAALSLAAQLGDSEAAQGVLIASALYANQLAAAYLGDTLGSLDAVLAFNIGLTESAGTTANLGASALFANELSLSLAGGRSISDAITLALETSESLASDISVEGSLLLNLEGGLSQANEAVFNAALALDAQLIIAAISQGVLNAGLSLSCIQSVSVNGATLSASLVTPGGRTLTVTANTRSISVNGGNRDIIVNAD